jgi:putative FmdB family regulatory protein
LPLYEYQCDRCGRFEVIQKFSDSPLTTCPKCGRSVHKLPSAPAIQFKGTGWYVTDYARKSSGEGSKSKDGGKEAGKDAASSSSSGDSSSSKSESGSSSKSDASKAASGSGSKPES